MKRNALPQPLTLALAIGLALANISVARATDYTISGASGQVNLNNGDTLSVLSNGTVTGPGGTFNFPVNVNSGGVIGSLSNAGSITATGGDFNFGIANYGTVTDLTNTGSIASSGGTFSYGITNYGTITTLTHTGTITYSGGTFNFGIANYGTITSFINGQTTPLTYFSNTPGNYYTYFNTPSSYGKVNFTSLSSYTLPNYGLRIAAGQNYAAGTYTGVIASDSALTISTYEAVSGVTYHLVDAGGGLNWNLVIDSVSSSRVFDGANALGNSPAYNAAHVIDANPNLLALFAPLTSNAQLSSGASQTTPVFTGDGQLVARATLDSVNQLINDRIAGNLGLASGNSFYGDKHVWMRPFGSVADQDASNGVAGYKANSYGLVFGVDGGLSGDALRLGAAFAYAKSDVNGQDSAAPQSGNIDVYQLIGYGSYRLDGRTAVSFQADLGQNNNDTQRNILFAGTRASASYHSLTAHLGAGVGRTYALGAGTTLTPTLRADYTWIKDDSYTETGAGLLNLSVNSRSSDALVVGVDGKLVHPLNDRTSLITDLGVGYDTINDQASITSAFAGAPSAAFITTGIKPSPWIGRGAVGVEYKAQDGLTITGRYDAEWRTAFLNQTASLNLRKAF